METLLVLGLVLLLLAAAAPGLYALRKRFAAGEGQLEIWEVLQRRGLSGAQAAAEPRALAFALRRCALCPSVAECQGWLAAGGHDGLERFCPNAGYLESLERP